MLQRVAACCSVLQCGVVLQRDWMENYKEALSSAPASVCCSVLQRVVVCCSVLHCAALCCGAFARDELDG